MAFYVTMVTFWVTLLMDEWTSIVMDDGWIRLLAKTLPCLVSRSWWNVVVDDWNLDEKPLGQSDSNCNNRKVSIPQKNLQGMTNYVGLTVSGGDTIPRFTLSIGQDN